MARAVVVLACTALLLMCAVAEGRARQELLRRNVLAHGRAGAGVAHARASPTYAMLLERMAVAHRTAARRGDAATDAGADAGTLRPDASAAPAHGHQTHMVLEDGTDVTVYAPSTLDLPRLKAVADAVVGLTGSRICSCFCAFATQAGRNRADPFGRVECLCADRSTGEQIDNRPQPVPLDVYGERAEGDQSQRFRYPLPAHGGLVVDGLRLSLDAGDRLSWPDAGHTLADVSGGEHSATLHGRVAFEEDGMGCLRFGRNGTQGDHATLELDISPRAMPALTLELWVKLHSLPNPHGWAFGHDTGLARYDRGILMHAAAFEDPSRPGAGSGATAMGVGHPYMSELTPRLHEWTHVVATWGDSGVATLYHNAVGSDADSPADNGEGGNKLVLGGHVRDGGAGVDACIAVARVYDRALAAAEVQANFDFLASRFGK